MIDTFDKEKFLSTIHTIPSWVKNGDDLLKFCKHLHYRFLQEKAVNAWYEENFKLSEEKSLELFAIIDRFDEVYINDESKFQPFEEIFN